VGVPGLRWCRPVRVFRAKFERHASPQGVNAPFRRELSGAAAPLFFLGFLILTGGGSAP